MDDHQTAWIRAELRRLEAIIDGVRDSGGSSKVDQAILNEEVKDIRMKYVPREALMLELKSIEKDRETDRSVAAQRWRTFTITVVSMGLTILALAVSVVGVLVV